MIWWQWQLGISEMGGGQKLNILIINLRDHVGCGEVWSIPLKIFGVHASLLKLY